MGGATNVEIFHYIKDNLYFDQLIYEMGDSNKPDWIHVSYNGISNRKQVLRATKVNGKSVYSLYK